VNAGERRRWLFAGADADLATAVRRCDLLVRRFLLAEVLAPPIAQREDRLDLRPASRAESAP
jgi:hypothetical protein